MPASITGARAHLKSGVVIPAHPLALTPSRALDERRQRALTRYYVDAGAGGVAVGVHTTQFAIRDPRHGMYRPVLELAAETVAASLAKTPRPFVTVAGLVGKTEQAVTEAEIAKTLGYHAGLLSLAAYPDATDAALIKHCRAVAEVIPLFGFYLQPAVGGRVLGYEFWREFAEIENVWAVKIAPFDRYRTLDAVRGIAESGREDIALYTGNDDNIVNDLTASYPVTVGGEQKVRTFDGGLLGQWAVWTRTAVVLLDRCKAARAARAVEASLLRDGASLTDANAAIFDAGNSFAGCIPGIHEILRRQGLLAGVWCLDTAEKLSPGQGAEIDRICRLYPSLADDAFVRDHLESWMRP
ncbi:MAG TPA: dihydrodipicolinate synthase family protein [Gemmatimonadaceae bacterium]|jgi:dihydrodipicolinate synthase/N-acetylneuraminate lyase